MTRQIRHSPDNCAVGDFFQCPVEAGDNLVWYYQPRTTLPPAHWGMEIPLNAYWPPRWTFHRAQVAWRSDSGPFVLDVFVRKS